MQRKTDEKCREQKAGDRKDFR